MGQGQDEIWSPDSHTDGCYEHIATINDCGDRALEKANARLIAAAPELLEALQECLGMAALFNRDTDAVWRSTGNKCHAAIRKALGEEK